MTKRVRKRKKQKKKHKGKSLLLTCLYCGEDLKVYIKEKKREWSPTTLSRGRIQKTENRTIRLTVKCRVCRRKSIFERHSPHIGRFGWMRVDTADVTPYALRPRLSEISETSAMLRRRRRR